MKRQKLPSPVLAKLVELDEEVGLLERKHADAERGIEAARRRLVGSFSSEREYEDVRASLAALVADAPTIKRKLDDARMIRDRARLFIDQLPPRRKA